MRVRDWQDVMTDVVESDVDPEGWRAVAGDRSSGVGEDLFMGHPAMGVFQLKTYARNPFEVQGVGTQVARKVDGDLESLFPAGDHDGRFSVQNPPEDEQEADQKANELEGVLEAHAEAPTTPGALFDDVMDVLDSPAFGPMEYDQYDRPDPLEELSETFADAEAVLDAELDDLVEENDVGRGFY
jgi:hypothetical protein